MMSTFGTVIQDEYFQGRFKHLFGVPGMSSKGPTFGSQLEIREFDFESQLVSFCPFFF